MYNKYTHPRWFIKADRIRLEEEAQAALRLQDIKTREERAAKALEERTRMEKEAMQRAQVETHLYVCMYVCMYACMHATINSLTVLIACICHQRG